MPGAAFAVLLSNSSLDQFALPLFLGLISTCLIASANYVINEWLDADFDRFHPVKKNRPAAMGKINPRFVYLEYLCLVTVGLGLAQLISPYFLATAVAFIVMGILYNVRPFRTKERVFLDVLSESVNNPIRLMLGWFAVVNHALPPASLLLGYWMCGAFLMGMKRYAEFRCFDTPRSAGLYRRSFQFYSTESLLISSFFYANCAAFFLGVFLVKYRVELIFSLPLFAFLFAWYTHIAFKPNSPAQHPERLFREKKLSAYLIILIIFVTLLISVDIPWLDWFLENAFISQK